MANGSARVGLRPGSVLVVDDNAGTQKTLTSIIEEAGYDVVTAATRKEAIALSDRRAFDVAFVDKRLVEFNDKNEDGLAILRHISRKNEGTYLILLTGYGQYDDAVRLSEDVGFFQPMKKNVEDSEMEEKILDALRKAAARPGPELRKGLSARIFCGQEVPGNWEVNAKNFLRPSVGMLGLMNFLDEVAQTCHPLFERPHDNGVQPTEAEGVMAGLYWSRGVGEAVVVALARDEIPDEIPRADTWPTSLKQGEVLYHARRKNLLGAIIKCTGVEHTEFTVARSNAE